MLGYYFGGENSKSWPPWKIGDCKQAKTKNVRSPIHVSPYTLLEWSMKMSKNHKMSLYSMLYIPQNRNINFKAGR